MSNWCLGCHRTIPSGDYCASCRGRGLDHEAEIMLYGTPSEQEALRRRKPPPPPPPAPVDDIPF